jgi:hypothetical protein
MGLLDLEAAVKYLMRNRRDNYDEIQKYGGDRWIKEAN